MIQRKKGQAAMEFLMTYGWAILAAIIVVGVLWVVIGNPFNIVGNEFQLSAPLAANAMSLSAGILEVEFRNGLGDTINVTEIALSSTDCSTLTPSPQVEISSGQFANFTITCDGLGVGETLKSDVTISYTSSGSSLTQKATGSISGRVA